MNEIIKVQPKPEMRLAETKAALPMFYVSYLGARTDADRPDTPCTHPSRSVIHEPPELRCI